MAFGDRSGIAPTGAVTAVGARPMTPTGSHSLHTLHLAPGHVTFDTRVFVKECSTLVAAGHRVSLLVRHDRDEIVDGVRIIPLPAWRSRSDRFLGSTLRCLRIALRERADVYHLHDAEMLLVGALLALLGRTVVLDSHEDYPRLARDRTWIPALLRPLVAAAVGLLERAVTPLFAAVISAEDEGAKRFRGKRVRVVRNYALPSEFSATEDVAWEARERRLAYVGAITRHRGAIEMVDVLGALDRPGEADVRLTLIGPVGESGLDEEMRGRAGWPRVDQLGLCDRSTVAAELARARVGFVLWHPTRKHAEGAVPVKLFEYLAAGLPVIASDFPAIRDVVEQADVGVLVDPHDVDEITAAVRTLLDDPEGAAAMGKRGRELVRERYTWDSQAAILVGLYAELAEERMS